MYRPFINELNIKLGQYNLYSSQWGMLRMIADEGPISFGEIASLLYIEKPSVTRQVQKLVDLQLVEIKSGKDKREKIVHLSANGHQIVEEIQQNLKPSLEAALSGVSSEEIEIAKRVLAQIRLNLKNG